MLEFHGCGQSLVVLQRYRRRGVWTLRWRTYGRDWVGLLRGEMLVRLQSWTEFVPLKVLYPHAPSSFEGPPRAHAWTGYEQREPEPDRDDSQPEPAGQPTARAPENPDTPEYDEDMPDYRMQRMTNERSTSHLSLGFIC